MSGKPGLEGGAVGKIQPLTEFSRCQMAAILVLNIHPHIRPDIHLGVGDIEKLRNLVLHLVESVSKVGPGSLLGKRLPQHGGEVVSGDRFLVTSDQGQQGLNLGAFQRNALVVDGDFDGT